jgi:hypothetical protein
VFHSPYPGEPSSFSVQELTLGLLLAFGLCFPTSSAGTYDPVFYQAALIVALCLQLCLAWKCGIRSSTVIVVALPMAVLLAGGTFHIVLTRSDPVALGTALEYSLLLLILSLDLRNVSPGRLIRFLWFAFNLIGIACGVAILAGNDQVGNFLITHYSAFYDELLPNMMLFHKPVLTFATHSLAGFFLYLFFWINWELYKQGRALFASILALAWLAVLIGLVSFTSAGFAVFALAQVTVWLWKHNRGALVVVTVGIVATVALGVRFIGDYFDVSEVPELLTVLYNSDISGPGARYGAGGSEREHLEYLVNHPLSPVGFSGPVSNATVDSAPIVYLLRGSVPLLCLIYFGLYRFLRFNLDSRHHAITLFLVIVAFETGFNVLTYYRTFFLLPLVVIALNAVARQPQRVSSAACA